MCRTGRIGTPSAGTGTTPWSRPSPIELQARFRITDSASEDFSVTRSEYIQTVTEACEAPGVDLSTTHQQDVSGELTVERPAEP